MTFTIMKIEISIY